MALWLEARRRSDLYRWGRDPVDHPILRAMHENAPDVPLEGRAICHPFSRTMRATNPNL